MANALRHKLSFQPIDYDRWLNSRHTGVTINKATIIAKSVVGTFRAGSWANTARHVAAAWHHRRTGLAPTPSPSLPTIA